MSKNIENPFVGLKPYSEKESAFYFGREEEVESLLEILQKNKLLTLSGDAGSGKTSLINAGLIPRLRKGFKGQTGKDWAIASFRPGINPLSNLAHSLTSPNVLQTNSKPKTTDYRYYLKSLQKINAFGIVEIYKTSEIYKKKNLLIVIDQLEDLFVYKEYFDAEKSKDDNLLMNLIYESVAYKNMPIYVLIAIESNYITKLALYKNLQKIINATNYSIKVFDHKKIKLLIEKTFAKHKVKLDPSVIEDFYEKLNEDISYLPNFQFLLYKLFNRYVIRENIEKVKKKEEKEITITAENSKEFGEIHNAISIDLEVFYEQLNAIEKKKMSLFFKALTKPQAPLNQLSYEKIINISKNTNTSITELSASIQSFKKALFHFIDIFEPSISEIKHDDKKTFGAESILNLKYSKYLNWSERLKWIKEERKDYLEYEDLAKKAIEKEIGTTDFIKTIDLESAKEWSEKYKENQNWAKRFDFNFTKTLAFIDESEKDEERLKKEKKDQKKYEERKLSTQRKSYLTAITIIFLIAISCLTYFSVESRSAKTANNKSLRKNQQLKIKLIKDNVTMQNLESKLINRETQLDDSIAKFKKKSKNYNDAIEEQDIIIKKDSASLATKNKREVNRNKLVSLNNYLTSLKLELNDANKEDTRVKTLDSLKKFSELKDSTDFSPQGSEENIIALNQKILTFFEKDDNYKEPKMLLAKSENDVRNFTIYNKELIAFGGDDGKIQFYSIDKGKQITFINEKKEDTIPLFIDIYNNIIDNRIRRMQFLDKESLLVTTVSGKILKVNLENLNSRKNEIDKKKPYELIRKADTISLIDFFVDPNNKTQFLVLQNKIIKYNKDVESIIDLGSLHIEASFYTNSTLFFVSNKELYTLDRNKKKPVGIKHLNKLYKWNNRKQQDAISKIFVSDEYYFIGTNFGHVYFYTKDFKNETKSSLRKHGSKITSFYFDEDSKVLFTAGLDSKVFRYDFKLDNNKIKDECIELLGHNKWIWHMDAYLNKDNKKILLTADADGNLLSWYTNPEDLKSKIESLGLKIKKLTDPDDE